MNNIVLGILAHVDSGKTTLSEGILYETGTIRKIGRVDNKDAFLDTHELEKDRGITIFSKQAVFDLGENRITLLDTPGHVDFQAEMERTLQVLDYAILVISGADGVQGHTHTLWKLLKKYNIPVFFFVNKMDQPGTDKNKIMDELRKKLDIGCVDFSEMNDDFYENAAMCSEDVLEKYMDTGIVDDNDIMTMISDRQLFPCYFGSALKMNGIDKLLEGIEKYTIQTNNTDDFGAKVFKIARDENGNRLTYVKVTGGALKVKSVLCDEEKINQIRIYSGDKYTLCDEAVTGMVCALTGLTKTYPGQGIGAQAQSEKPILQPVLTYAVKLPDDIDANSFLPKLLTLEEEEPELNIVWDERTKEIHARLMGEIQIEILKSLIKERFGVDVEFGEGKILYKETILQPVEGVGHFEPLRHYAEVHLLIEPLEQGSGMEFGVKCSEDVLAKNWQRLILTHLEEKTHVGVLTGSPTTDMRITLIAGRAHEKHTEGGDFRQSTYRAIRQGLRSAKSVLLEPYYEFVLEIPQENVGRALSDIDKMNGSFEPPMSDGDMSVIKGNCPVVSMRNYQKEVTLYTHGHGRLMCEMSGYRPCHNQDEIVAASGYDPEGDLENPTGSVFCSHGSGFTVAWNEVRDYMHIETPPAVAAKLRRIANEQEMNDRASELVSVQTDDSRINSNKRNVRMSDDIRAQDKELQDIFERTYGSIKKERYGYTKSRSFNSSKSGVLTNSSSKPKPKLDDYLLVDGYNIIFSWEELHELAQTNLDGARYKLLDILCNYQGVKKCNLIAVFDAYKVKGFTGEVLDYHNIKVVFTKEAETADAYIEKTAHNIGRKYHVTVATSDGLEQIIIRGEGCFLLSAKDLRNEIEAANVQINEKVLSIKDNDRNYLFNHADEELANHLEEVRLGRKEI